MSQNSLKGLKKAPNSSLLFGIAFLMLFSTLGFINGCASMKQPEGGPRDSIAPKILKETPKNLSLNFNAKSIIIEFDEYFSLQNQSKEFNISPEMIKPPMLNIKGKTLVIDFQDTLEKNTTYTLNFGESIQDVNESNKLKNYRYVFATGAKLDSLGMSGTIYDAETNKAMKEALVFIVPIARDTTIGKKKPSIYTATDTSGNFSLHNLRADKYHVYAIEDPGGDKIYQQNTDKIGFIDSTIDLKSNLTDLKINVFKEVPDKFVALKKQINGDGSIGIILNKKIADLNIKITDPAQLNETKKEFKSKDNDTIKIWLANMDFDSVKMDIKDKDSILQKIRINKSKKEKYNRTLTIFDNASSGALPLGRNYTGTLNFPIESFDVSKIELMEDSVKRTDFKMVKDSSQFLNFKILYPFKQKKKYSITYQEGAITGMYDSKNKKTSNLFKLASPDDFGTLTIKYTLPDSNHSYLVQLVDLDDYKLIKSDAITKNTAIVYRNFPAKKYYLRVIYDVNKNKNWDTGNVKKRIQPEKIWYAPKQMYLRANWETEEKIEIPK